MYDESSFPLRNLSEKGNKVHILLQSLANSADTQHVARLTPGGSARRDCRKRAGMSKVVQAEAAVFFLFEYNGNVICWVFPLTCPLQVVDRGTGENLRANRHRMFSVPGLEAVEERWGLVCGSCTVQR